MPPTTVPPTTVPQTTVPQTTEVSPSVQDRLDELQAERNRDWDPVQIEAHAALRQALEAHADRGSFVKAGDVVAPFVLPEVDGGQVVLSDLLARGPVVLIFFRFADCPACNAALGGYHENLAPTLRELGAALVAISPQVPEKLVAIKARHGFDFAVASDTEARLLRAFGIAFAPDEVDRDKARRNGHDMGEILGTGSWELPYPTVVVIRPDGVVALADVHPNWMVRTESDTIIEAVRALV